MKKLSLQLILVAAAFPYLANAGGIPDEVSKVGGNATFNSAVSGLTGAQVVAGKNSSSASVKASRTRSYTDGDGFASGKYDSFSLTASSPLNKSDDDSDIATLDGLVNAASLELTYSHFLVPGKRSARSVNARRSLTNAICERLYKAISAKDGGSPADAEKNANCDTTTVEKYLSDTDQQAFRDTFWDDSKQNRWLWGGSGKVGYQDFNYVNKAAFSKEKQNETPWSVRVFVALNPEDWNSIFILSAQYQDAYKDSTSGVVCPTTSGSTDPVTCLSGPVGSPKETKKKLLSLESRRSFSFAGIGLTTTYDFEEKVFGVELPVYFVQDKEGKFNGGVKGGWRDDTHDFSASVFVGSTFQLFE